MIHKRKIILKDTLIQNAKTMDSLIHEKEI